MQTVERGRRANGELWTRIVACREPRVIRFAFQETADQHRAIFTQFFKRHNNLPASVQLEADGARGDAGYEFAGYEFISRASPEMWWPSQAPEADSSRGDGDDEFSSRVRRVAIC